MLRLPGTQNSGSEPWFGLPNWKGGKREAENMRGREQAKRKRKEESITSTCNALICMQDASVPAEDEMGEESGLRGSDEAS